MNGDSGDDEDDMVVNMVIGRKMMVMAVDNFGDDSDDRCGGVGVGGCCNDDDDNGCGEYGDSDECGMTMDREKI